LASEVALTGQYETTRSHIKVKIDPQSIVPKPGQEEFGEPPVRDDQRSLASRIYQVTAPNVYFRLNKMNVEYVQTSKLANDPDDTGERIRSNTTGKFLNDFEGKQIRRPGGGDFDATGKAAVMAIDAEITCPSNEKPQTNWFVPSYEYVGENNSPADLSKRLKDALDNGEGPLVLDVRGQNAPFWKVNRGHVVTIDSYRPGQFPGELPTFFMDNQWGEAKDHHYESVYVLARARGHGDPRAHSDQELTNGEGGKEFAQDLLQLKDLYEKYRSQNMSPAEFKHAVLDQLDAIFLQMHQFARPIDGHLPGIDRFDQHGYSLLGRQMATILSHLPKAERQAVIKHMKDLGVLNNYIE
jgi:hypothetical protein